MSDPTVPAPNAPVPTPPSISPASPAYRKLRVWPAAALVALIWALKAIPILVPEHGPNLFFVYMFGPAVCALGLLLWWAFASRATGREKLIGLGGLVLVTAVGLAAADASVRSFIVVLNYLVPWAATVCAAALIFSRAARPPRRAWVALAALAILLGYWDLRRYDGMIGAEYVSQTSWRWEPTAEDHYLAELAKRSAAKTATEAAPSETAAVLTAPEWPGFRGPHRDAAVAAVSLDADWEAHPPKTLWKRKIGPGWSSFAVAGKLLFTQEQRGESEAVVGLDADSGEERWIHEYPSRFSEAVGGVGPRATPTLADGALYALGAEGLLHRLDPLTGKPVWQRDLRKEAGREPPIWGFSSSPLVAAGVVVVHAGGEGDKGVLAFDAATGEPRWSVPAGDHSYSSPQLARLAGREFVLMLTNKGLIAIDPAKGAIAWEHAYALQGHGILQPLVVDDRGLLMSLGADGTRRLRLEGEGDRVTAAEVWTSRDLKPDFNDTVLIDGHLYGFDGSIFSCVDLATGERRWKKGRYGAGQVLGLPDAKELLVLSESGDAVLVRATPEKLDELARHKVLDGKTWNHPALVGGRLYVRNGEEAAAYEMPVGVAVPEVAVNR